jgi:hypothetical protein
LGGTDLGLAAVARCVDDGDQGVADHHAAGSGRSMIHDGAGIGRSMIHDGAGIGRIAVHDA